MKAFIINLARGAGAILREGFYKKKNVQKKPSPDGFQDMVTEYDFAAEKFIIDEIRRKFPSHGILGEESGHLKKGKNFWIIDPLDGTHAFVKGVPQFSTTFSFVSDGRLKHGVVYDPIHDELFYAEAGKGAILNNRKIRVSKKDKLQYGNFACYVASLLEKREGNHYRRLIYERVIFEEQMWNYTASSVALGAAYVACGRNDVIFAKGLNPWDISGGALIMKEAGAKITDLQGKPYKWSSDELLAGNPVLHRQVLKAIK